jgi:microcystin-dependent protein
MLFVKRQLVHYNDGVAVIEYPLKDIAKEEIIMSSNATGLKNKRIPAGAVLPYAGTYVESNLGAGGWMLCDGSLLDNNDSNKQLFDAIGTANGGTGAQFNLPDYRGIFLRGVCKESLGTSTKDPDRNERTAPVNGAASGDNVGSIQQYATAMPCAGNIHMTVAHIPHEGNHSHKAEGKADVVNWDRIARDVKAESDGGGDSESRPKNIYVDFIIQSMTKNAAKLPAGLLVAMTALETPPGYLLCDGSPLNIADYNELYNAIGKNHGGTDSSFNLPDIRGRFLRGRTGDSSRDPDAAQRTWAAPGGNIGNAVGSLQADATGKPQKPFTAVLSHCPDEKDKKDRTKGNDDTNWPEDSGIVTFGISTDTWDAETRPANLYVDWYIKVHESSELPVGSIIAIAGDADPGDGYLPCRGQSIERTVHPDLFAAIGTLNGGDGQNFNLPDCRGLFLRGVDHGANHDPNAIERYAAGSGGQAGDNPGSLQDYATKQPTTSITGAVPHLPTSSYHETAYCALGDKLAARNKNSDTYEVHGGDKETRPVNIYVAYYIKNRDVLL